MILERIKSLCKKRNISVLWLEGHLDIGKGVISSWSKKNPTVDNLQKVADYFGVTLDYLVKGEQS